MIYLDTETELIRPQCFAPPLVCLQFARDDGPVGVAVVGVDPVEEIADEILRHKVVGHNIAFDLLVLLHQYPRLQDRVLRAYEEDRVSDTIVREKLQRIAHGTLQQDRRFSLADLAKKYGGVKDSKDPWRLRYAELRGIPFQAWPVEAQDYAVHDVEATRLVYQSQEQHTDEARQVRAAMVLHYIGATGIGTDPDAVDRFEASVIDQYQRDQSTCRAAGLVRDDGSRDSKRAKDLCRRALEAQGLDVPLTKTGQVSVNEDACLLSGDPTLQAYQRYGSHKNLLTRLQGLKRPWLHPSFDSLIDTGRTSCSTGQWGYQIQNMRRLPGERECFVPRPGNVILACDYESFELCALAQVCLWTVSQSRLAQALRGGIDPHLLMAATLLGESYDDLRSIHDDPDHSRFEEIDKIRQGAKVANFGLPGGMGAKGFVAYARGFGLSLTLERSKEIKAGWLETWPEMILYFRWISDHPWREINRGSWPIEVTTIRQLRSDRVRAGVSWTTACNTFFQGLAADAAKAAGWALFRAVQEGELAGWEIWNFIHDEYLLQGPEEDGHRAAQVVRRIMEQAAQEWMPDVPIRAKPTLMRRWTKGAKQVWEDGGLVPWA